NSADTLYTLAEGYQVLSYLASLWVFETDPNSYRSHQLKGQYFEALKKDDQAIQEYRRALAVKPDLQSIHFSIGNLLWTRNRSDEALLELKEEIKINDQAIQEYRRALAVKPDLQSIHFSIGNLLWTRNRSDEALLELKEEIKI